MRRDSLRALYGVGLLRRLYHARLPCARPYGRLLAGVADAWGLIWGWLKDVLVYDPMLRARCDRVGTGARVHGTFPLIENEGRIEIGDRVVFCGKNNLIVGLPVAGREPGQARLVIGDDVAVGYWSEINVAESVVIGDHVRMATGVMIFDNNSHPLDPEARRRHAPMTEADVAPVVIEDDVWVGMNAIILKGVRIGRGAVIAAGSVVTKDVPERALAAGNPARVVKHIDAAPAAPEGTQAAG